ncbi:Crp/Fnr family transcriptional regulator [Desertibaculum subflavum]|uniref:Crp/Fnr family transcriptional regulator n=1 Tax=Desertibaculum subflavum TaxID=2268458 RepID=UPI0034D1C072
MTRGRSIPRPSCRQCPLRRSEAFKAISGRALGFLSRLKVDHIATPQGHELIRAGDVNPRLYTLYRGWAFRYKTLSDGRRQILNFLLPGDLIGVQANMFDASPHAVEALTDAEFCVFSRRRLWDLYANFPELAFDITWLTAHEEGMVDDNLLSVGRRSAAERVAALLMQLYKRAQGLGLVEKDGLLLPITQQHIADALGISLVHTNKTMRRLVRIGLFQYRRSRLQLTDPHALERLADYFEAPLPPRPLI